MVKKTFRGFSRLIALAFITIASNNFVEAQEFGGNPLSLKWSQINTDTARIIFPKGLDETAQRVAAIVHDLQKNHTSTIGSHLRKVNIVLQNQTTESNAYVALAPYRSEFYLFAPQNSFELGGLGWADQLAIHEYRHVEQYSNFNVGLSKLFGILFGQAGQAVANAAAVPDWFFEGDAVFNETALSTQGRGRIPSFFDGYKSLFLQDKNYSYMKLRNGSLKHYVPDHYPLGYMLVAYGREKYGADFWKNVSHDAAAYKPLIYPWQGSVKKYAGISYKQFVKDAFAFYNQKWQRSKDQQTDYITPVHRDYVVDYKYPYLDENGDLLVVKNSYRHIPAIYKITENNKPQKIASLYIGIDDYFSYNNGKIVFAAYKPNERWGYQEFSDITMIDMATNQRKTITHRARYFSPDISHSGQQIVAVNMGTNQQSNLEVIDTKAHKIFRSEAKRGIVYTYPKFSSDDKFIYAAVRNEDGKMALVKIQLSNGKETNLVPFANRIIGFPTVQGDTIFFSSSFKGSDEIWAFIESKNEAFRVATNATGFYQAVYQTKTGRLITSNFSANGYRLAAVRASSLLWKPITAKENDLPDLYVTKALEHENKFTLENISSRNFAVKKYNKSYNIFNFHSWQPDYTDPEFSLTIYGENILNTLQSQLSYTYNRNEGSSRIGVDAVYGGWYVQPTIGVSETFNRNVIYNRDTSFFYNEFNAHAGAILPLNFTGGRLYRYLTLSGTLNNQQVSWTGFAKRLLRSQSFNYVDGSISYVQQTQKAVQQIYPRFAQALLFRYRSIIDNYSANQFLANASFYFPGFFANHSVVIDAAYQQRDTLGQYAFSNNFPFSRGYNAVDFPRMWRVGANYHFPLFYPDWGFADVVYFQRIRANIFYDYTNAKSLRTGNSYHFNTVGSEIFFDTKWWNQQSVNFGLRYSHLLNNNYTGIGNGNVWEIILPVNLFNH